MPIFVAAVLLKQPPRSEAYMNGLEKTMYIVLIVLLLPNGCSNSVES